MTTAIAEQVPLHLDDTGTYRVGGTRVTLETVIDTFNEGVSAEEILFRYDSLRLADVYLVIGYYLRHKEEVSEYLREREALAATVRKEVEARQGDMSGIRERLMRRKLERTG